MPKLIYYNKINGNDSSSSNNKNNNNDDNNNNKIMHPYLQQPFMWYIQNQFINIHDHY